MDALDRGTTNILTPVYLGKYVFSIFGQTPFRPKRHVTATVKEYFWPRNDVPLVVR